ncbi:SGNH/GDSL hydrolase family protein [Companilactobacillus baiquanensis]|uniref:SGNH/GDSL hydrolase family protein n=1 Tax=Companilactobacillus baiquanensis TaxID=2486005 RepID=A0ABW1UWE1_9LACO|nr:SGNH/GDSL hydrolase family protein [Companilactobacillus baiquanensis]
MKRKKIISIFLLLFLMVSGTVFLSSCSSQKEKPTQTSKTTKKSNHTTKKKEQKIKTVADRLKKSSKKQLIYAPLGDSLSVGLFADSKSSRFTTLFANDIEKATGKSVSEQGISVVGKTASNFGVYQVNSIVSKNPDIVTVEFGTNDAAGGATPSALNAYENSMNQIVDTLQEKTKAQIILMTTWSPKGGEHAADDKQFDQIVYKIAKQKNLPVADLSTIWEHNDDVTGPAGKTISDFSDYLTRDNFHPNQLGHDKIAELLNKELNREGTYER